MIDHWTEAKDSDQILKTVTGDWRVERMHIYPKCLINLLTKSRSTRNSETAFLTLRKADQVRKGKSGFWMRRVESMYFCTLD